VITDALKSAGIRGSWQHLGTSNITGCVFQIGKNDHTLGDHWRTLDVRPQSVCGVARAGGCPRSTKVRLNDE
jgi:hypothetical protein